MDGWITPSAKKPRLGRSNSPEVTIITPPLTNRPSTSSSASSTSTTNSKRSLRCQFGSKCYRRNPNHLQEFSHPVLDMILNEMKETGDFLTIPEELLQFIRESGMDSKVVLEQIQIIRSSSAEIENKNVENRNATAGEDAIITSSASSSNSNISNSNAHSSLNDESWQKNLEEARLLRRNQFMEKQSEEVIITMQDKWIASCPFNFFLTKVTSIKKEKPGVFSANFKDLFDPSLGEVKASFHANFMIEMEWFMDQLLKARLVEKPTWIVFDGDSKEHQSMAEAYPWLKINGIKSPFPFGHHHSKMSIVQYTDLSVRFFIYTANLIESDWDNRTQGIWISPKCPKLDNLPPSPTEGDSCTKFKSDIIQYLKTYPVKASAAWIDVIKKVDCSVIKVFFIGSAPITTASGSSGFEFAQGKIEKVLKSVETDMDPSWPLVIQCSSIGSLGKSVEDWVGGELAVSMSGKDRMIKGLIHVIYPSHSNVHKSFDGLAGGGCLPYGANTHAKQSWLERHFCQWKAECTGRSRAVPHIKGYCRISPDASKIGWFLLSSANLSKAAWGKVSKRGDRLSIMSWEVGILFHPKVFTSQTHFTLTEEDQGGSNNGFQKFPLPFDIPVVKYEKNEKPWFMDTLQALISIQRNQQQNR